MAQFNICNTNTANEFLSSLKNISSRMGLEIKMSWMEVISLPRWEIMSAPEVLIKLTAIFNQWRNFQMAYMAFINFHITLSLHLTGSEKSNLGFVRLFFMRKICKKTRLILRELNIIRKHRQNKINFINLYFKVLLKTENCETIRIITGFYNS